MRLFRGRAKPKIGEEDNDIMPAADTQAAAAAATEVPNAGNEGKPDAAPSDAAEPDTKEAETAADAPEESARPQDSLLAQIGAEADAELAKEEAAAAEGEPPTDKDELDPELLDIFRDARNEVQESSLAAELEDISVQELLDHLASVSRRLGVPPRGPTTHLDADMGEPSNQSPDADEPNED